MKIVEMLRLNELGMSQRQIAQSAGCGKSTVGETLKLCKDKGVTHTTAKEMSESELHATLYPESVAKRKAAAEARDPDWSEIHAELVKNKGLNLQFLWEEYRAGNPEGYSYSRFCKHYRDYRESTGKSVSLYHERKAGDIMEVDWMGETLDCVVDPSTGEIITARFFVAVLGYSGMPYVEAFPNEQETNWITAHVNALSFYGGVPRQIVPDNCKTAVKTPRYYEPVINTAYWELSEHYEVAIIPARVRKPKDKAVVEQSIGWLETWLLGKLRKQRFFSFSELNKAVKVILSDLSKRPYQKREGTRLGNFTEFDKPALRPLPLQRYEIADVIFRRVGDNYHIEYDGFHYSVPYTFHKAQLVLRATSTVIEFIDKNHVRVASHKRRHNKALGRYVSNIDHMPPNHKAVHKQRQFDGKRYLSWSKSIGEHTHFVIETVLSSSKIEEQGYRACMGILQFTKTYGNKRLEAACAKAVTLSSCTYSTVKSILSKGLDMIHPEDSQPTPSHGNIRGSEYYN